MIKKKAFTLIELLVVIVVIGILATISTATFSGYIEQSRLAKIQSFAVQIDRGLGAYATGWWDFEEGSGTSVMGKGAAIASGTFFGDPQWSSDTSEALKASDYSLDFDGSGDYVSALDGSGEAYETISFWFYTPTEINSSSSFQALMGFGSDPVNIIGVGRVTSGTALVNETLGVLERTGGVITGTYMTDTIEPGWHHVAFIANDNGQYDMYYDGERPASVIFFSGRPANVISPQPFVDFGRRSIGNNFTGKLDNIRFFSESIDF